MYGANNNNKTREPAPQHFEAGSFSTEDFNRAGSNENVNRQRMGQWNVRGNIGPVEPTFNQSRFRSPPEPLTQPQSLFSASSEQRVPSYVQLGSQFLQPQTPYWTKPKLKTVKGRNISTWETPAPSLPALPNSSAGYQPRGIPRSSPLQSIRQPLPSHYTESSGLIQSPRQNTAVEQAQKSLYEKAQDNYARISRQPVKRYDHVKGEEVVVDKGGYWRCELDAMKVIYDLTPEQVKEKALGFYMDKKRSFTSYTSIDEHFNPPKEEPLAPITWQNISGADFQAVPEDPSFIGSQLTKDLESLLGANLLAQIKKKFESLQGGQSAQSLITGNDAHLNPAIYGNFTTSAQTLPTQRVVPQERAMFPLQPQKKQLSSLTKNLPESFCRICKEKSANVFFMPCGHLGSCDPCAWVNKDINTRKVHKCPICQESIRDAIKVYLA